MSTMKNAQREPGVQISLVTINHLSGHQAQYLKAQQEPGQPVTYTATITFDHSAIESQINEARLAAQALPEKVRKRFVDAFVHLVLTEGKEVSFAERPATNGTVGGVFTVTLRGVSDLITTAMNTARLEG
ncbi:hypothetical protein [Aquitalea aquatica]|uniref:Uncharacterized protein n=1 Tax=Aquitalea aquatica TaxID=3044273 RepID=A0A838XWJ1_9NEIS|nr:hypothetical protein [Aquitalea magnusonii]MBA4707510.1 hypothetical protein [Aquitalea magnusonii]